MPLYYANVRWAIEDIQQLRPNMTDEMAEDFLIKNQKHIRDRSTEFGWTVIESLLDEQEK